MQFNNILAKQKSFFLSGATLDPLFRIDQLNRMLLLLDNHEHEFYFAIKNDFGKSSFDTYISELGFLKRELRYFIKNISQWCRGEIIKTEQHNYPRALWTSVSYWRMELPFFTYFESINICIGSREYGHSKTK